MEFVKPVPKVHISLEDGSRFGGFLIGINDRLIVE